MQTGAAKHQFAIGAQTTKKRLKSLTNMMAHVRTMSRHRSLAFNARTIRRRCRRRGSRLLQRQNLLHQEHHRRGRCRAQGGRRLASANLAREAASSSTGTAVGTRRLFGHHLLSASSLRDGQTPTKERSQRMTSTSSPKSSCNGSMRPAKSVLQSGKRNNPSLSVKV